MIEIKEVGEKISLDISKTTKYSTILRSLPMLIEIILDKYDYSIDDILEIIKEIYERDHKKGEENE